MRRKKHKHTRRAVSFFKVNFGFHEPYKVLLDGNFVHATHQSNLSDLSDHIPRLLGGKCRLYTTKCVTHELRSLGADFAAATTAARGYVLHKCSHTEPVPAAVCLAEQMGSANASRWWLATQDQALRKQTGKVPGCPLVFASVNGLHLEEPSGSVKKTVKKEEETVQSSVPVHELRTAALEGLEEIRPKLHTNVRFRRQKIKGPNSLACKKKATKKPAQATAKATASAAAAGAPAAPKAATAGGEGGAAAASGGGAARKRKRKSSAAAAAAGPPATAGTSA